MMLVHLLSSWRKQQVDQLQSDPVFLHDIMDCNASTGIKGKIYWIFFSASEFPEENAVILRPFA